MQVVILAGGSGTRAYPYTEYLPKPMMPVGGKPILLRVMDIYARQGVTDFIISVGYRKEVILDYFDGRNFGWSVDIVDTGVQTDTGGRIRGCRHLLGDTFMHMMLYAAPFIAVLLLLEFGIALLGVYSQQLQVSTLAPPLKCLAGLGILLLYFALLQDLIVGRMGLLGDLKHSLALLFKVGSA